MAGKPGRSGRKGAGKEFADFEKLWQQWSDPKVIAALMKKDAMNQPMSIQERFLLRAYDGLKERDAVLFKKLFPDTNRLEGPEGGPHTNHMGDIDPTITNARLWGKKYDELVRTGFVGKFLCFVYDRRTIRLRPNNSPDAPDHNPLQAP